MESQSRIKIIKTTLGDETVAFAERKGIGHPDTLADNLAEHLSATYSRYTLKQYGAVLHHNFDKLGILGGKSSVQFGKGEMISPIRVLINGRISSKFGEEEIPFEKIITDAVYEFIELRFGNLIPEHMISIVFNISTASSPGHADDNGLKGSSRNYWFQPRSLDDLPELKSLFSNDTSIGCGYYPLKRIEAYVLELEKDLTNDGEFSREHPWAGSDVKIMGSEIDGVTEITLCVPQIADYVLSLNEYIANIATTKEYLRTHAAKRYNTDIKFNLNTRDDYDKQELYLTATGSSIESGDEGLVGRGNRVNQVISINSPMSMEGASGKNPVYHIGKLYYIAAHQIAQKIHDKFNNLPNEVYLVSNSGLPLVTPWKTVIKISDKSNVDQDAVVRFAEECLLAIPDITRALIEDNSSLVIA